VRFTHNTCDTADGSWHTGMRSAVMTLEGHDTSITWLALGKGSSVQLVKAAPVSPQHIGTSMVGGGRCKLIYLGDFQPWAAPAKRQIVS